MLSRAANDSESRALYSESRALSFISRIAAPGLLVV
jgi:hypothetical protein